MVSFDYVEKKYMEQSLFYIEELRCIANDQMDGKYHLAQSKRMVDILEKMQKHFKSFGKGGFIGERLHQKDKKRYKRFAVTIELIDEYIHFFVNKICKKDWQNLTMHKKVHLIKKSNKLMHHLIAKTIVESKKERKKFIEDFSRNDNSVSRDIKLFVQMGVLVTTTLLQYYTIFALLLMLPPPFEIDKDTIDTLSTFMAGALSFVNTILIAKTTTKNTKRAALGLKELILKILKKHNHGEHLNE